MTMGDGMWLAATVMTLAAAAVLLAAVLLAAVIFG